MKIAVITCYRDPDYIRARALRASLASLPDIEVIVIKNKSKGVKRYLEVILQIIKVRATKRPDAYLLTFRGYEIIPVVRLLSLGKPLIFDELVNGVEWFVYEHKKLKGVAAKVMAFGYRLCLLSCRVILADTESHADVSSGISKIDRRKYLVLPVSTDETAFSYSPMPAPQPGQPFRIFFYGAMLPLHGPKLVFEAAEILKDNMNIEFLVAGKIDKYLDDLKASVQRGARITYRNWVPFDELSDLVSRSAVNIAGPLGNTFQGQYVINGKTFQFLAAGRVALVGESKATEPFKNRENCLLVPQGDAGAIAREILWAYDNQNKLPAIGEAGRKLYDEQYSNAIVARALEPVLKSL